MKGLIRLKKMMFQSLIFFQLLRPRQSQSFKAQSATENTILKKTKEEESASNYVPKVALISV
jgi:hypothetical protein